MKRHLEHIGIECSERFRFQSFDALKRILVGFGFPAGNIITKEGYCTNAEEMAL
jgi:hypothetical protein